MIHRIEKWSFEQNSNYYKLYNNNKRWLVPLRGWCTEIQFRDISSSFKMSLKHWGQEKMTDDTFKCIFDNQNLEISSKTSLKFVPMDLINNISSLVQIMAWHRPGTKQLCKTMVSRLPMYIWVTRPQMKDLKWNIVLCFCKNVFYVRFILCIELLFYVILHLYINIINITLNRCLYYERKVSPIDILHRNCDWNWQRICLLPYREDTGLL